MRLREFILHSDEIIKHLCEGINQSEISLKQAEEKILEHINRIGQIMVDEVVQRVKEPVGENRVVVDEKLGIDRCGCFSPLMTYLQALFGACESFERSEELLSTSMGSGVSATAIQRNTEATGARIR